MTPLKQRRIRTHPFMNGFLAAHVLSLWHMASFGKLCTAFWMYWYVEVWNRF